MSTTFDALYALQFGGSLEFAMSAALRWLHREHLLAARRGQPQGFRNAREHGLASAPRGTLSA